MVEEAIFWTKLGHLDRKGKLSGLNVLDNDIYVKRLENRQNSHKATFYLCRKWSFCSIYGLTTHEAIWNHIHLSVKSYRAAWSRPEDEIDSFIEATGGFITCRGDIRIIQCDYGALTVEDLWLWKLWVILEVKLHLVHSTYSPWIPMNHFPETSTKQIYAVNNIGGEFSSSPRSFSVYGGKSFWKLWKVEPNGRRSGEISKLVTLHLWKLAPYRIND